MGGSVFPDVARNLEELVDQADKSELQAKLASGDRVVVQSASVSSRGE
jgi:hypothetical protein